MHEPLNSKIDGLTDEELTVLLQSLRAPEGIAPRAGFYGRVMDRVESQRKTSIWSVFLEPAFSFRLAAASLALMLLMGVALYTGGSDVEEQVAFDQPPAQSQVVFVNNENEPAPALVNGSVDALHAAPVSMMDAEHGREVVLVDLVSYQEH
jgi:hypothetical protein